jgi:hypothetical protein
LEQTSCWRQANEAVLGAGQSVDASRSARSTGGEYSIVVEGYDWGAGVSKVILSVEDKQSKAAGSYSVFVKRHTDCDALASEQASGEWRAHEHRARRSDGPGRLG